jgi:TolA-binding protein
VSLGGLLLESGQGDEALAAFDSYLAAAPSGGLVPESLAGRARALKSVGREAEAARAWRELARRYPDSPYAGPRTLLTP